jgi:6-phosphofructokinase
MVITGRRRRHAGDRDAARTGSGLPVIGVPKTIDNDLAATVETFGFGTAVQVVTDALDRLRTTAESHDRIMLLEVMGRDAGWIALHSGIAGGADVVLLPELPYEPTAVAEDADEGVCDGAAVRADRRGRGGDDRR